MPQPPLAEEAIFLAALDKATRQERAAYIEQACAGNDALRTRVLELLASHDASRGPLDAPPAGLGATADQTFTEQPGTQIGPYKLLQQIGEGGMGVVYMAEQTKPMARRVALKIIKPGMDTRQVIARFEAERQALSLMDHPNIAKVFDAGTTVSGRPFFVMELVKGQPITQYCDDKHLTPRQRLELLLPVCQAIQHAHQKGIIHRDIKPTNILVAEYDHQPVPKVIDFGVAKATSQTLTEKTMFTGFGEIVGTLEYMSPEQAKVNQLDIDTRSDIYSLGVLLYELLTGSTPFDKRRLRSAAWDEMLRIIREEEPPKPSTRLSDSKYVPSAVDFGVTPTVGLGAGSAALPRASHSSLASIAAVRGTEPARLTRLVRGELDWIVMKALEKDRNRRYETANGLALDIQRYLTDEPVQACPPSAGYRLSKFARRNKRIMATAGIITMALVLGTVVSVWQAIRATKAEGLAQERLETANANYRTAEEQRRMAKTQEELAKEQRGIAVEQGRIAKAQELLARRRFYAVQTNLAEQAWEAGQPARTLELLESQRPRFDQEDLRGFEWYYLWRLCHRNLYRTLRGPSGETVYTVGITPDETTLVSASRGDTVRVWDVATGKERAVLMGHKASIWRFAISPDGKIVATASMDHTVKLWDLGTSELLTTLTTGGKVRSAAFAPDGKVLAVGTEDGGLELWDIAARQRRLLLPAHFAPTVALAYSPDGKLLVTGAGWSTGRGPGGVKVWDATSEPLRIVYQAPEARWAAFSPDSKLLATCGGFGVKVWNANSGELQTTLKALGVDSVAFAPDGNAVLVGGRDRTVKLWEFATGATRTVGVHLGAVKTVACFPRGNLLASGSNDGLIKVWHAGPPQEETSFAHDSAVRSLAFTADSKLLVVGSDLLTPVLDATTGKKSTTLPVSGVLAASADANLLMAAAPDDQRVIWDVATARSVLLPVGPDFAGAAFARDGKTLVTWIGYAKTSRELGVRLWDVDASRVRLTLKIRGGMVMCAAFSPDGGTLATGQQFGPVTLWDTATGKPRITLQPMEITNCDAVALAFSRDGKQLAAGNSEGLVRLWNVETGQLKVSFKGHTEGIRAVAFSPDAKTLLSGSADKTARLWDVATGQEVLSLKEHKFPVHLVAFAPDGKRLATASHHEVKLWLAATEPEATAFRVELDPDDPESPRAINNWGDRLQEGGRPQEASHAYRQAQVRLVQLAAALPDPREYREEFAYSLLAAAVFPASPDRAPQKTAEDAQREARGVYQRLPPDQQRTLVLRYRRLSRLLATGPDPQHRNSILALELAKRTVELFPQDAINWYTLGVAHYLAGDRKHAVDATAAFRQAIELDPNSTIAWQYLGWSHYRTGNWKPSIEALEKSCELQEGTGDCGQWIILALSHARLATSEGLPAQEREHHQAEANRWFEQANKQIDSWWHVRPADATGGAIWDFREEAREVMRAGVR